MSVLLALCLFHNTLKNFVFSKKLKTKFFLHANLKNIRQNNILCNNNTHI